MVHPTDNLQLNLRVLHNMKRLLSALILLDTSSMAPVRSATAVPFSETFESGYLDASAWTISTTSDGQALVTSDFGPAGGTNHLVLQDRNPDTIYSRTEVTLSLNLAGR